MPVISTLFFLGILVPLATALSFNFPTFDQRSLSNITLQGNASWSSSPSGCIQLTRNQQDANMTLSVGRAVYKEPLLLWDAENLTDFSTHFTFIINPNGHKWPGDGMAFFLSPYPSNSSIPPSFSGCGLGLFNGSICDSSTHTLPTPTAIVAVEFDTYQNTAVHDPLFPHVGIDVGSLSSVVYETWKDDGNTNGSSNQWQVDAWVSYNSGTHNLSVFLTLEYGSRTTNYSLSYIVDLRLELPSQVAVGFSASTGVSDEIHELLSWNFSSTLVQRPMQLPPVQAPVQPIPVQAPVQHPPVRSTVQRKSKMGIIVGTAAGAGILLLLLLLLAFVFLWSRKKKNRTSRRSIGENKDQLFDDDLEIEGRPKRFSYEELATATRNFSDDVKLGEGGFGSVYKGHLEDLNLDVAIKRFAKESSRQGRKEYFSEVNVISRLGHRNLVKLVGWCHDQRELLLVYEYLPNGSLDSCLYSAQNHLRWPVRYKIALDLASAMIYLHHDWEQCVLHRDVKSSNIMLDSAFNAKLGDFGLARLINHDHVLETTMSAGTLGYMAPECVDSGKANKESDVYSFGVVALEIACGRRPSKGKLVEWVWELYAKGATLEAADEKLNGEFDEEQMERVVVVGLWCAHPDFNLRPSMKQAINVLNGQMPLPINLPPR
ncbi:L-type lectin-domain containing receptor kinase IX.1-like [Zingiber officinale]|uniref:non-specific serine/threonine protein kinase n=1 Tax=Zingiber officinale TaxID=94328 RepID=A0A8J5GUY7_ZINOF|nr:L-type lectin-domain containing receptor kinase IX.1-like [Zingiber officinale]KAG6515018.1 hypothetical protein ZIOFF_025396 [Zingiber officinale]